MNEDYRSWLARKLERWEQSGGMFNSPLIRLLISETWFRVAFAGICLLLVFLALFLPKIWSNTPKDFSKTILVSGLDHLQAWSLKRAAIKAMAEGRDDDALQAWREALANTPGNPDISRGMLRFLLKTDKTKEMMGHAYSRSEWLLELTRTNLADVELVAKIYEKYKFYDSLLQLLDPLKDQLSPEQEAGYLKALFSTGRLKQFAERLVKTGREKFSDSELPLYEAAYQAGWGPETESEAAKNRLVTAQKDMSSRVLATRLLLVISRKNNDLANVEPLIQQLSEWRADTAIDHVDYWELMESAGRREQAVELAKNYPYPPKSASELIRLSEGYLHFGLDDLAEDTLKRFADKFGYSDKVWRIYSEVLIKKKRWDDVLSLATQIRRQPMVGQTLSVFSYYLDGVAQNALRNKDKAQQAFQRLAECNFTNRFLTLDFSTKALQLGYPEEAQLILHNHRQDLEQAPSFWLLMLKIAYQLKQPEQMLEAATKSWQLDRTNRLVMNNYAATLLTLRAKPEEAMQVTTSLLSEHPDSTIAQLNHCLALLLNQRTSEAKNLLLRIDPLTLNDEEHRAYQQAWLEIRVNLEQWDDARESLKNADRSQLLAPQIKWLEEAERKLGTNAPPASKPKA